MKTNSSAIIVPAPSSATNGAPTNSLAAADIRDIKAPVEIPSGWLWLWCVLGGLGIALASYVAWRYWQKHRTKPKTQELIIPPHVRARRKLEQALSLIYEPRPFCILSNCSWFMFRSFNGARCSVLPAWERPGGYPDAVSRV